MTSNVANRSLARTGGMTSHETGCMDSVRPISLPVPTKSSKARRVLMGVCCIVSVLWNYEVFAESNIVGVTIARAEELLSSCQPIAAIALLDALLTNDSPAIQRELAPPTDPRVEPPRLIVSAYRVSCMNVAKLDFSNDVATLLEQYRIPAQDNAWGNYAWLYEFMGYYYRARSAFGSLEDVVTNKLIYTKGASSISMSVGDMIEADSKKYSAAIERIFNLYNTLRPTHQDPSIEVLRCKFAKNTGSNAFNAGITFLDRNPAASLQDLSEVVPVMRAELDVADPDQIAAFYRALLNFAIRQPATDDRIGVVAYVLNEKRKLDTLLPELKSLSTNEPPATATATVR